jgi:uncharacterized protein YbjT (DUF2867 family)
MSTFLVIGATGTVGSELACLLESAGHTVRRATSRNAGPGQVHLDLTTGAGLSQALSGADGAFLLSPPGHTNQDVLLGPVIEAASAHGVGKIVLMTAMGADADPSAPMRCLELQLEASGLTWNVIRPNWLMQNFHTFWLYGIRTQGAIQLPTGSAKGSFLDARDIAAVAAALLTGDRFANRAFDLTGDEALDHAQVAALLCAELGHPIRYDDITPELMRPGLLAAGLPEAYADFLLLILHYFKLGAAERITAAVKDITGYAPRRFAQYAHD